MLFCFYWATLYSEQVCDVGTHLRHHWFQWSLIR